MLGFGWADVAAALDQLEHLGPGVRSRWHSAAPGDLLAQRERPLTDHPDHRSELLALGSEGRDGSLGLRGGDAGEDLLPELHP